MWKISLYIPFFPVFDCFSRTSSVISTITLVFSWYELSFLQFFMIPKVVPSPAETFSNLDSRLPH